MDTLHTVLRNIRGETKSRPDHMTVFREFLNQLERVSRKPVRGSGIKGKSVSASKRRRK